MTGLRPFLSLSIRAVTAVRPAACSPDFLTVKRQHFSKPLVSAHFHFLYVYECILKFNKMEKFRNIFISLFGKVINTLRVIINNMF